MPNRIILRSNSTAGVAPSAGSLVPGELAINTATGAVFTLLADNTTVRTLVAPGGVGATRIATPTWSANMTLDWSATDLFRITLAGATTDLTFTGAQDGQKLLLELTQDGAGDRAVTWPASIAYSTTIASITLSTAANKRDRLGFIYNAVAAKYDLVAIAIGY